MSSENLQGRELLTTDEATIYELIKSSKEEDGHTLGNKQIAQILDISRNEASRLRASVVTKLGLIKGF